MAGTRIHYDTAVVGAGPVGSLAALSLAQRGDEVLLLEANPAAAHRFAGEWLHPPAVEAMRALGIEEPASAQRGRGFVVFPDDGSEPIVLPYSDGSYGLACEHHVLVEQLRAAAVRHPHVTYRTGARFTSLDLEALSLGAGSLEMTDKESGDRERVRAGRVVGADGRSSVVRAASGGQAEHVAVSRMAGLVLEGVKLPYEGFGHVFLGAPGSVLAYRIAPDKVRICVDLPQSVGRLSDADLISEYGPHLCESLRTCFIAAIEAKSMSWAAIRVQRRRFYGREGASLVGDSVGYYHPLTAAGMTLGFADAIELSRSKDHDGFRRRRLRNIRVPELLAMALYEVFTDRSDEMAAMRHAIYTLWRTSPTECARTMRFLACQDTRVPSFLLSFVRVMRIAGLELALPKNPAPLKRRAQMVGRWFGRGVSMASGLSVPMMQKAAGRLGLETSDTSSKVT